MGARVKYEDWPQRLNNLILARHAQPFAWGANDCCIFAADVVYALTGVDHAAELRGRYRSAAGAARVLRERGGVQGIATAALGDPISPLMAQRGDVVMVPSEHGEALAVCIGATCVVPGPRGLATVRMSAALAAWRVT